MAEQNPSLTTIWVLPKRRTMPPTTTEAPTLDRSTPPEARSAPNTADHSTASHRAVQPAGFADGTAAQAFLCAAMWSSVEDVAAVLKHVADEDFEQPGKRLVAEAVRALADAGQSVDGVSVGDWLTKRGRMTDDSKHELSCALTAGLPPGALWTYAAALVAESFRESYATLGETLLETAGTLAEHNLLPQLVEGGTRMRSHHQRLTALRTHN